MKPWPSKYKDDRSGIGCQWNVKGNDSLLDNYHLDLAWTATWTPPGPALVQNQLTSLKNTDQVSLSLPRLPQTAPGMSAAAAGSTVTVHLQPLSPEHLKAVKTLNNVLFPIKYHVSARGNSQWCAHYKNICSASLSSVQERVYEDALACGPVSQLGEVKQCSPNAMYFDIGHTGQYGMQGTYKGHLWTCTDVTSSIPPLC
jgi:hypothetical protein